MDLALFLTYFFPPLGGGGVLRSAKFAKYLPRYGWKPIIVSANPNSRNSIEQSIDRSVLKDVTSNSNIYRCDPMELSGLYSFMYDLHIRRILFEVERFVPFLHMDYKIGYYFSALKKSMELMNSFPIKLVYSSSPPYSSHFVGMRLKRKFQIPWVADFRDPWTFCESYKPGTVLNKIIDRHYEKKILNTADVVIANTNINKINLINHFRIDEKKIHVIPNGYDDEDFYNKNDAGKDIFVISCIGKFYETPNVDNFFAAFRDFQNKYPRAQLNILGALSRNVRRAVVNILKPDSYVLKDRINHDEAIRVMQESSVLLANVPNEECNYWVPGKLYEYLGAKKPILFVGPKEGEAADIVKYSNLGKVVSNSVMEIYGALEDFYLNVDENKGKIAPNAQYIAQYERKRQTEYLAKIFSDIE
jgi:glycosyltransferase involved in cell wall biosynthesis